MEEVPEPTSDDIQNREEVKNIYTSLLNSTTDAAIKAKIEEVYQNKKNDTPQNFAHALKNELNQNPGLLQTTVASSIKSFHGNLALGIGDHIGKFLYDSANILIQPGIQSLADTIYGTPLPQQIAYTGEYLKKAEIMKTNLRDYMKKIKATQIQVGKKLLGNITPEERVALEKLDAECAIEFNRIEAILDSYIETDIQAAEFFLSIANKSKASLFAKIHEDRKGLPNKMRLTRAQNILERIEKTEKKAAQPV